MDIQIKDGIIEGDNVYVEVTVAGGSVSLVIPKAELDALATKALKVAKVVEILKAKVYLPVAVVKPTVALAGTVSADLSVASPVIPRGI